MILTSLMQVLDTTIANVALPHMQSALGTTADTITWVLTSYIIANAITLPIAGWASAKIGSRKLYIASVAGFVITSMLCGLAQNLEEMVIFRAMQGITGAFFLPLSQSTMLDATRPSKHAQIMAVWGSVVVVGPILGPILGGWLTENWNWRWVFYVNVPIGAVALTILTAQLPKIEQAARRFDITGFVLIGFALASLQLLLDRGHQIDWFQSTEAWIYLLIILSAVWAVTVHILMADHPLFDRVLFTDVNFVIALVFIMITGMVLYASIALLPPMLQNLYGYDTIDTGILLAPRGLGFLIASRLLGLLLGWNIDQRVTIAGGFLCIAFGAHMMAGWSFTIDWWDIFWPGLVQGIGMGLVFIPLNTLAFATLAPHLRTDASSLLNLFRLIGSSTGISIMTALFARNIQVSHSDLTSQMQSNATSLVDVTTVDRYQIVGDGVFRLLDAEVNRQAAMIAYLDDFQMMLWMTLLMLPLILLIRKRQSTTPAQAEAPPH